MRYTRTKTVRVCCHVCCKSHVMNDVASTNIYLNVQSVLQEAKKDYYKGTKKDVAIVVDEQDFLPPDG